MGLVGAGAASAARRRSTAFPYWLALAVAWSCGTLFAAVVELIVIRRLFDAPRVDRARRDGRHRPARRWHSRRLSRHRRPGGQRFPQAGRSAMCDDRRRSAHHRRRSCRSWWSCRARRRRSTWLLHRTHVRQARSKASADNRRPGPAVRRQPQAGLDVRVDGRRAALDGVDDPAVAAEAGRRPARQPRPDAPCRGRCSRSCSRGMRSFPRRSSPASLIGVGEAVAALQLPRPARPDRLPRFLLAAGRRLLPEPTRADDDDVVRVHARRSPARAADAVWWVRNLDRIADARRSCSPRCVLPLIVTQPSRATALREIIVLRHLRACRSRSSPAGPGSCRWRRWRSPASARCSPRRSHRGLAIDVGWVVDVQIHAR